MKLKGLIIFISSLKSYSPKKERLPQTWNKANHKLELIPSWKGSGHAMLPLTMSLDAGDQDRWVNLPGWLGKKCSDNISGQLSRHSSATCTGIPLLALTAWLCTHPEPNGCSTLSQPGCPAPWSSLVRPGAAHAQQQALPV